MKAFFKRHQKLHLWLAADSLLLAVYLLCRHQRTWMNALADDVTNPFRRLLGRLCYQTDESVMEILCVLLAVASAAYLLWSAVAVIRAGGHRRSRAYSAILGAVCAGLTIYNGFCLLWGVNYWTDNFQEKSGIYAEKVRRDDLTRVTEWFARQLSAAAAQVPRDQNGSFAVSREEILKKSPGVYDALEKQFPFLTFDDTGVKAMRFSRLMSAIDFTGFYCPYTGEANVNVDSPACLLPSTGAHEMAHQRGIASEQECNFLAVLASTTSGDPAYVYAGWLMGYIHLGNALYVADPETYWAIRHTLPETVERDLAENSAYWDRFRDTAAQKVSNKVYDGLLKSYGDENGIRSYGTVVDLLVAYYR